MPVTKNKSDKSTLHRYRAPAPRYDEEELRRSLQRYNRQPFVDLLSEWLQCAPSPERVREFAEKNPEKYIQAVSQLARLGGFTEKTESQVSVNVRVEELSDSQLEEHLRSIQSRLVELEKKEDGSYAAVQEPSEG